MGLTPLEGLVMGTRSGDLDPSIIAFMAKQLGWGIDQVTNALNKQSGLLGLSGGHASDSRQLMEAAEERHAGAQLAIEVFCYRLAKHIAGLSVGLGSLDALMLHGGIGEHSAAIRHNVLSQLGILGFHIDEAQNGQHGKHNDGIISVPTSTLAMVIPTNEELQIAKAIAVIASETVGA